jgi:hypothetical protein
MAKGNDRRGLGFGRSFAAALIRLNHGLWLCVAGLFGGCHLGRVGSGIAAFRPDAQALEVSVPAVTVCVSERQRFEVVVRYPYEGAAVVRL